jgi:hypothetical protein
VGDLRSSLFQWGSFMLSSGGSAEYKIECDALTDADVECLSHLLLQRLPSFGAVEGVPRGGLRIADYLQSFVTVGPLLIVDDVYTTGRSLLRHMGNRDAVCGVLFARTTPPPWVCAVFVMTPTSQEYPSREPRTVMRLHCKVCEYHRLAVPAIGVCRQDRDPVCDEHARYCRDAGHGIEKFAAPQCGVFDDYGKQIEAPKPR